MIKLHLIVGANQLSAEGDIPLADLLPLVTLWGSILPQRRDYTDATARLASDATKLTTAADSLDTLATKLDHTGE